MSRRGRIPSITDPRAPNANLLTRRWSPTRRLSSIDSVGILKAWTMNVVPNNARITVITSDSKYSRAVDFVNVGSVIRQVLFLRVDLRQRLFCGSLLRSLFRQSDAAGNDLAIQF